MAEQDANRADQGQGPSPDQEQPQSAQQDVDSVLEQAQSSLEEMQQAVQEEAGAEHSEPDPAPAQMPELAAESGDEAKGIELLGDVDLDVTIELGRTRMLVEDVLKLGHGSVVELDKLAGDPVDVHVNGRLVARGEVLVLNDNFCIRISEIVANLEEEAEAAQQHQAAAEA
ncbi:MAG: flagellar motor switch protein FliN [Phycisphaeraceae bacterium]